MELTLPQMIYLCVVSVQRRLALEMEVKRNERIQSEQQTDLTNQCDANANVKVNIHTIFSKRYPEALCCMRWL